MNVSKIIESKIDRLINLRLTKGVQPEDLANNIYLNDYKKICFYKSNGYIIGELNFTEIINNNTIETILRYVYDEDTFLLRIEEEINNEIKIEWDRDISESILINDIVEFMNQESLECAGRFIESLPQDLKGKIENAYFGVA